MSRPRRSADAVDERGEPVGELAPGVVDDEVAQSRHVLDDVAVGVDDRMVELGPDGGCVHRFPPDVGAPIMARAVAPQRTGRP